MDLAALTKASTLEQFCAPLDIIRGMAKLDAQISVLQDRLSQLKLRQQRADARKRALEALRERKAETRRQFVVGSVILSKVKDGAMDPGQLRTWLDQMLTRDDDRRLFGLHPKREAARTADDIGLAQRAD